MSSESASLGCPTRVFHLVMLMKIGPHVVYCTRETFEIFVRLTLNGCGIVSAIVLAPILENDDKQI